MSHIKNLVTCVRKYLVKVKGSKYQLSRISYQKSKIQILDFLIRGGESIFSGFYQMKMKTLNASV